MLVFALLLRNDVLRNSNGGCPQLCQMVSVSQDARCCVVLVMGHLEVGNERVGGVS